MRRGLAIALGVALGALACDRDATPRIEQAPLADPAPRAAPAASGANAAKLYQQQGCSACHGANAQGGMLGPTLAGLGAHWSREDLAAFLTDPEGWVQRDARLAEQKARYAMPMPGVPNLSEPERLALADWLLAR